MRRLLVSLFLFTLGVTLTDAQPLPAPARMGINVATPQVLSVFDRTGAWVPLGIVDSITHNFYAHFSVLTNQELMNLSTTDVKVVIRQGVFIPGDAPDLTFVASTSPCSISGGDIGTQVTSRDGKCWLANPPASGEDIREWGAVDDGGIVDQTSIFNTADTDALGCVILPSTTNGFYIVGPYVVNHCLTGTVYTPINPYPSDAFPGTSWIRCAGTANSCIVKGTANSLAVAPYIRNIIIAGQAEPATTSAIGLQNVGLFNALDENVMVYNFDTCIEFGPQGTTSPITFTESNLTLGRCQTNFMTVDGTPEIRVTGGRFGLNGSGGYTNSNAFVLFEKTTNGGSGSGPNTIAFRGTNFFSQGIACAFDWANWTGSGGVQAEYRFEGNHVEWHGSLGSNTGVFCSDSSVPTIASLFVSHMLTTTPAPLFAIDASTTPEKWYFTDNVFGCTGITLDAGAAVPSAGTQVHFSHNFGCSSATFTTSNTNANWWLDNNNWGALTISGQWGGLSVMNDRYGTLNDTATGNISWSTIFPQSWTPILKFGGAEPTGIVYSVQFGQVTRTATGGIQAYARVAITNLGTGPAPTDTLSIAGLPYTCGSGGGGSVSNVPTGTMTGLTGALGAYYSDGNIIMNEVNSAGTGQNSLTFANFTNTSDVSVTATCGRAS